jgi:hypothetical protein
VTVGRFAWVDDVDGVTVDNYGTYTGAPSGFVHRDNNALITEYLGESSMVIPKGFPVTLFNEGDFWAKVAGATAATVGASVYANYNDGTITIGSASTGASVTATIGSTSTAVLGATFTASADTDATQLVVTSVTGLISIGDTVAGTGITGGTTILSQVSGTAGGAGTYKLSATNTASAATVTAFGKTIKTTAVTGLISIGDTVAGGAGFPSGATIVAQVSGTAGGIGVYTLSAAGTAYTASATGVTSFGSVLNVTAVGSGTLYIGAPTNTPTGAVITAQVSGATGGVGVYTLDTRASAYTASGTVTTVGGVLTAFKAQSVAAVGELVKISTRG